MVERIKYFIEFLGILHYFREKLFYLHLSLRAPTAKKISMPKYVSQGLPLRKNFFEGRL